VRQEAGDFWGISTGLWRSMVICHLNMPFPLATAEILNFMAPWLIAINIFTTVLFTLIGRTY
jgi:hypothetical protein